MYETVHMIEGEAKLIPLREMGLIVVEHSL
jgi:hypothetical protein